MSVYENRSLFSDYYLQERLADHAEWAEDVTAPFERARAIYEDVRDVLAGFNEAQTEQQFIIPLLRDVLGITFETQVTVTHRGRRNVPDYAFFPDEDARREAQRRRGDEDAYYARATAIADAKYWGRPLDAQGDAGREALGNANPSFQIVNYLVATGVDWGVLTNGARWRLYYGRARSRVDTYFEVDLARILEEGDRAGFRYFYQFFRAGAFRPDPHTGQSFLEAVYAGSVDYGVALQRRLKDLIFDEIFVRLATGFLDYRTDGRLRSAAPTQAELDEIYQGTLRLLYRLLFLLHAEARDLLPVHDEHGYGTYSLTALKRRVAKRVDGPARLSSVSTDIWNDLDGLFRIIDRGDPRLNVPRYNGGLFRRDVPQNAFLNENRVPDYYLAPALMLLTRERPGGAGSQTAGNPETGRHRFIDYKALDVEQLGSIYEGLLEFHLRLRDDDDAVSPTPLYLENDKGERKATGSYYTPHYIVEYIVEHTLGPVLEERAERFRALMETIVPKRERLDAIEANLAAAEREGRSDGAVSRWTNEAVGLREQLKQPEREAVEALLGIRVCDPAMGSGHFLVEATDWLAERIIVVLNEYPGNANPVLRRIAEIRERIVAELRAQGIRIERERLKDTNLLKRMVMKRCIYGVDLNPMAVELAKLSLWLDSFTVGAPLSFLDHHLKVGNSLIGARVQEVKQELERAGAQYHMFGGPFAGLLTATELMRDVAVRTDATFEEVTQSAEKYDAFEEAMLPYKRVLDLWVSRHFGNTHAEEFLRHYGEDALEAVKDDTVADIEVSPKYRQALERRRELWKEKRFFHWQLEFPEAFINLERSDWKQSPGFDAVIGNPPYERTKVFGEIKHYLGQYYVAAHGAYDIYVLFIERSLQILTKAGRLGYITSNKFLVADYGAKLRSELHSSYTIEQIIDLTECPSAFPEALVSTAISIIRNKQSENTETLIVVFNRDDPSLLSKISNHLSQAEKAEGFTVSFRKQSELLDELTGHFTIYLIGSVKALMDKLYEQSHLLEQVADIRTGIMGFNYWEIESIVHEGRSEGENLIRLLSPSLLDRFRILWGNEEVDLYKRTYSNPMIEIESDLLDDNTRRFFRQQKVVVRGVATRLTACVDSMGHALLVAVHGVIPNRYNMHFMTALMNSSLFNWIHIQRYYSARIPQGSLRYPVSFYKVLPIRQIEFTTPQDERERLREKAGRLYERCMEKHDQDCVLGFVEHQLAQGPERSDTERSDVVHDTLAFLAEQMIALHERRQRLEEALDPFKYLDKGVAFVKLPDAFAEEIKFGRIVRNPVDLGAVRHDIDGLRLVPDDAGGRSDRWTLEVQLKKRDPDAGWQEWQYEEGGNYIAREWVPAYRFELDAARARYYQHAFRVLDQFANARSFPGGYTRSTQKKLAVTRVPAYDPAADLGDLVDLAEELAGVRDRIARTDTLIDRIVYRLYGLTEDEIAIVEGTG